MKNLYILICSFILPIFSLNPEVTPNLCINCKFFRKPFMNDNKYGQCSLFPEKERDIDYFVTGIEKDMSFYYCSTARNYDHMCGKEGKKYVNKLDENKRYFTPFHNKDTQ